MGELFDFDSGMALAGAGPVVITDAIFAFDPEYNDGQTLRLELTMQGGEVNEVVKLGVGKNWTTDDGEQATRVDGRGKSFHRQTAVALLLNGQDDAPGLIGLMKQDTKVDKAVRAHAAKFPMAEREAGFWKGLTVSLEAVVVDYGGDIGEIDRYVISEFGGWEGSSAGPATGAAKKAAAPAKKATKKAAAPKAEATGGMTDAIRSELDKIADGATDHDEFVEQAIAAGHGEDEAVLAEIKRDDEGSIWDDACNRYEAAQAGEG